MFVHDALLMDDGDCMADMLLQVFLPLQVLRLLRHAVDRCAALCCVKFDCMQGDSNNNMQASGSSAYADLDVPCRIVDGCPLPKGNTQLSCFAANGGSCYLPLFC